MTMTGAQVARSIPRVLRGHRLAIAWFALQALGVALFWPALVMSPDLQVLTLIGGIRGDALWAFAAADMTIVATSVAAAVAVAHDCRNAWLAMIANIGVSAYPAVYFVALAVSGGGGEVAAVSMVTLALGSTVFTVASLPVTGRLPGRMARSARAGWYLLKTTVELVLVLFGLLWLAPSLLAKLDVAIGWSVGVGQAQVATGTALVIGGGLLLSWSAYHMAWQGRGTPFPLDAPRALVVDGPYRFVRNPQVVGGTILGVGLLVLNPTFTFVGYLGGGILLWQFVLRPWEEADLLDRFGEPYEVYQRRVPCWRPIFRGWLR